MFSVLLNFSFSIHFSFIKIIRANVIIHKHEFMPLLLLFFFPLCWKIHSKSNMHVNKTVNKISHFYLSAAFLFFGMKEKKKSVFPFSSFHPYSALKMIYTHELRKTTAEMFYAIWIHLLYCKLVRDVYAHIELIKVFVQKKNWMLVLINFVLICLFCLC